MLSHKRTHLLSIITLSALLLLAFTTVMAPEALSIPWGTVDGGGGGGCYSSSVGYSVCGTAGQPDSSQPVLQGGVFKLSSGFWAGPRLVRYRMFLPMVSR